MCVASLLLTPWLPCTNLSNQQWRWNVITKLTIIHLSKCFLRSAYGSSIRQGKSFLHDNVPSSEFILEIRSRACEGIKIFRFLHGLVMEALSGDIEALSREGWFDVGSEGCRCPLFCLEKLLLLPFLYLLSVLCYLRPYRIGWMSFPYTRFYIFIRSLKKNLSIPNSYETMSMFFSPCISG